MGNGSIIIVIGAIVAAVLFLPQFLKGKPPAAAPEVATEGSQWGMTPVEIAEPTLTTEEFQIELAALAQAGTPAEGYWISPHGE